jgi:hypothetical protein
LRSIPRGTKKPDGHHPSGQFNQRVPARQSEIHHPQRKGSSMSILLPESPIVPSPTVPVSHPTACPSWCKDRRHPLAHSFGPTQTSHFSPQLRLSNPNPLPKSSAVMIRAELCRMDDTEFGEATLYVQGETDLELSGPEADMFIAQAQAFVDGLRVLRAQMA